jgi:hypothetical protein
MDKLLLEAGIDHFLKKIIQNMLNNSKEEILRVLCGTLLPLLIANVNSKCKGLPIAKKMQNRLRGYSHSVNTAE